MWSPQSRACPDKYLSRPGPDPGFLCRGQTDTRRTTKFRQGGVDIKHSLPKQEQILDRRIAAFAKPPIIGDPQGILASRYIWKTPKF